MLAHDHLKVRAGEKVEIVSTFVSGQIKEDGERDIDPSKYHRIVHHVNTYLQQDMVSFCLVIHAYNYVLFLLIHMYNDLLIFISNCDRDLYDIYTSYSFRLTCRATIGI